MENLQRVLERSSYLYEILTHPEPLLTSQAGAEYFGIGIGQTAPTLIVKTAHQYFRLIIAGDRGRVKMDELSRRIGCERIKLASRGEVKNVTGFEPGWVPLIGIPLPVILDERLMRYAFVYGGVGSPDCTLRIDPRALVELNQVIATIADADEKLFQSK